MAKDYINFSNAEYLINGIGQKAVDAFIGKHLDDDRLFAKFRAINRYGDAQKAGVAATASAATLQTVDG